MSTSSSSSSAASTEANEHHPLRHHNDHGVSKLELDHHNDPSCKSTSECSSSSRTNTKGPNKGLINAKKQTIFYSASTLRPPTASTTTTKRPFLGSIPRYTSNRPSDKVLRELEIKEFYKNYDVMEGVLTAIVLGGFFAFVCLLVMYKTKCKPMWKNRRKRLTTTPATASVAELDEHAQQLQPPNILNGNNGIAGPPPPTTVIQHAFDADVVCQFEEDCEDEDFGFECIPLQSVCNEEDTNDDIYFLDEFGNYVFPVSSPSNVQGSCSCPPSAEELNSTLRRVSQVSSVSAAYTVKSLPGAYLYIPVLESNQQPLQSVPSLPSVKRALSDPQIHFAPPFTGHPIILTVNPTSDVPAPAEARKRNNNSRNKLMAMQPRSFSVNVDPCVASATSAMLAAKAKAANELNCQSIDINVIQPTPNISPSASLRSIDEANEAVAPESSAEEKVVVVSNKNNIAVVKNSTRRVSFSEDEVTSISSDPTGEASSPPSKLRRGSRGGSLATSPRQMTVPMAANATMSYLQVTCNESISNSVIRNKVPGQQLVAPHLTSEAVAAQTSPQARRRRTTRLLKAGSFCSISSEGDGDIFGDFEAEADAAAAASVEASADPRPTRGSTSTGSSGKFDPLSDYSEFHNDDACSDISDLFLRPVTSAASEEDDDEPEEDHHHHHQHQPINAQGTLSEQGSIEDITYEVPTVVTSEVKMDREEVSSCSLSIGSEDNNHQQVITVPVTIEHPPPEMRRTLPQKVEAACQQVTPASIAHHLQPPHAPPDDELEATAVDPVQEEREALLKQPQTAASAEDGMRMVLVRDIGIQVCGDSPNLNLARKFKPSSSHHHHHHHHRHKPVASKQDSLAEKFPAEILF